MHREFIQHCSAKLRLKFIGELMSNIDSKYESWKNRLLDLGKRNRLLNYKDTPRSNIKIEYPDCLSLYDLFVKEETQLVFPFSQSDDEENPIASNSNVETNDH